MLWSKWSRFFLSFPVPPVFFSSLARSKYLPIFSLPFIFSQGSAGAVTSTRWLIIIIILLFFRLVGLHLPSYFQVLQSQYQSFGKCTKSTNYNWYHRHFHAPQFSQFAFFQFYSVVSRASEVHNSLLSFTPLEFFTSALADGFSLEFEWLQVSRTRLSILAVLSNAVVWIISTHPPTSKSSKPFNNPLVTMPNAPITVGTIVTFMFHSFFLIL